MAYARPEPARCPAWARYGRCKPVANALETALASQLELVAPIFKQVPNRALLALSLVLWPVDGYLSGIDRLMAGGAAAGPALEEGLEQSDCLGEGQAGRW